MKRTVYGVAALAVILTLSLSGCTGFLGWASRDDKDAAMVAGAVLDAIAFDNYKQLQELDTLNASFSDDSSARSITVDDPLVLEYPSVTITVTREWDDNDTPDDPTDDMVTVTRRFDRGFEADRIDVLVRPLRPTTDIAWDSFDGGSQGWDIVPVDQIEQDASFDHYVEAVWILGGDVYATWTRELDDIYASEIIKEKTGIVRPNVVRRTIMTQDVDGNTTLVKELEVDGELVHSYVIEPYEDPDTGEVYQKILRDDGSYAIIIQKRGPRIVEHYNADGLLVMIAEERSSGSTGTVRSVRTFYDASGEITDIKTVYLQMNYMEGDEDVLQITRTVDGRQRILQITESGDVYIVTLGGDEYRVRVVDANTVEFLNADGTVYRTGERTADGRWRLTAGGEEIIV